MILSLSFRVPIMAKLRIILVFFKKFIAQKGDRFGSIRRRCEENLDQVITLLRWKIITKSKACYFDGIPRIALITVNFSTTRYLKLMLLTLCEQAGLSMIYRIIIVDNDSRDGGQIFLRNLAKNIGCIELIENNYFTSHARGLRIGFSNLEKIEADCTQEKTNLLLFCDTDIIFLNPKTLLDITNSLIESNAALAGELSVQQQVVP